MGLEITLFDKDVRFEEKREAMNLSKPKWFEIIIMIFLVSPFFSLNLKEDYCLDREIIEKLKKGKVYAQITSLAGSNIFKCRAMGMVYAPREKVWEVLSDYNHFKHFMPNISESFIVHEEAINKIERNKGNQIKDWQNFEKMLMEFRNEKIKGDLLYFYNRFNLPWPLKDRYYILEMWRRPRSYTFYWRLFLGNTRVNDGSWVLMSFNGSKHKTLAIYTLYVDPGISISSALTRMAMKFALPGTINAVRKKVLALILEERK